MHQAFQRLIEANAARDHAQRTLQEAENHLRQCALGLAQIEDEEERWKAAIFAYTKFGKGLSLVLAQAATGLPGRQGQSALLVRAGRKHNLPKGYGAGTGASDRAIVTEWPAPDAVGRDVIQAHIKHGKPYFLRHSLGWTILDAELMPDEAAAYLDDPTAALAKKFRIGRADFVDWLSSEGYVTCAGQTISGARCKALIAVQATIEQWIAAKARGAYCTHHGGNPD